MTLGLKMTREPQMDTRAPEEKEDDEPKGDAIKAAGFVHSILIGKDVTYMLRNGVNRWPISAYLSDRTREPREALFRASQAALNGNDAECAAEIRRYIELCAEEFSREAK